MVCLNAKNQLSGGEKPCSVAFADFHVVNIPTVAQCDISEWRIGKRWMLLFLKASVS